MHLQWGRTIADIFAGGMAMGERKPKTVSPAQIEANRRNAQKSTGPKTAQGRAKSKLNAFKHGLLSQEVLVRGKHAGESRREFQKLAEQFYEDLDPVGSMEWLLVDQIVTAYWRLRRVLRAEAGEIALNVESGHWKRTRTDIWFESMKWGLFDDPARSMDNSAMGNRLMADQLKEVRVSVEKTGQLTEAAIQKVIFHGKPYSLTRALDELRLKLESNPQGLDPSALVAWQKEQALVFIDHKWRIISWNQEICEEHERNAEQAHQAADVLPPPTVLDKMMRYETKLERQIYRAMNQLERLQRQRLGEIIPPPLTVEVTDKL